MKRERSAWGYNWATLSLSDINTGPDPSGWGGGGLESETVKYDHESHGDSGPRITALARASSNCKRQTQPV
jgi:hypothetical protein